MAERGQPLGLSVMAYNRDLVKVGEVFRGARLPKYTFWHQAGDPHRTLSRSGTEDTVYRDRCINTDKGGSSTTTTLVY